MAGQVDEIKARIDIVDLISEYIRLKQAGTNNWRALCPFHNEKTPSFMVSREKQIFHCFGCSEGGDIFSFVQKIEGMDFPEALRLLAQKAGVKLIAQDPKVASQKNRLLDICQAAANFWHDSLENTPGGKKIKEDYLKKARKLSDETIEKFHLGYATDSWDNLLNFLKSKGFKEEEIFLAGLTVKKDRGQGFYDRFRGRLMFPINNAHGSPIGFTGRILKPDEKSGKYINTPQTLIYNKSLVIFNLDNAKESIRQDGFAVVVEGQMDVVTVDQVGTHNVVASSGTAFTLDQIKFLKRYTSEIRIAFDMDVAGESAAKRGIDLALTEEMNVKVIVLPEGKDPDECIKNNVEDWKRAVKNAKSVMEYYFDQTLGRVDLNKVEGKKEAAKILLPVIVKIGNQVEQTHWLQKLAETLNVSESILRETLLANQNKKPSSTPQVESTGQNELVHKDRVLMLVEQILALSLKYSINIPYLIDNLLPEIIISSDLNSLYKKLILYYTEDIKSNIDDFKYQDFHHKIESDRLDELADRLVLLAEKDFFDFDSETIRDVLIKAINFLKESYYKIQQKRIGEEIKIAESRGEKDRVEKLIEQFNEATTQLNFLD